MVALVASAAGPLSHESQDEFVWSQAFYYGIFAATFYFLVATLMVITVLGAYGGHYPKDFQLTMSQRTLMLQTITFLIYLLVGALIFSRIEGWNYLDALYWADVTLFTVGFGDLAASTVLGRALLLPYALIGVISLGLVIGSIRSLVLERGRRRLDVRRVEKKRRKIILRMMKHGQDHILEPIRENGGARDEAADPRGPAEPPHTEFQRRAEEFRLMRKIQQEANRRRRWASMAISTGTWLALWLVGAAIFQACERKYQDWSYFDGFYLCFVSLTTIGYGDTVPYSNAGRSFFVFWSLLALPTMTVLISNAGDTIVKVVRDVTIALGNITILPGDDTFGKSLKMLAKYLTFGMLFEEEIDEMPPGFLGEAQPTEKDKEVDEDDYEGEDGEDEGVAATGLKRTVKPTKERSGDSGSTTASRGDTSSDVEKRKDGRREVGSRTQGLMNQADAGQVLPRQKKTAEPTVPPSTSVLGPGPASEQQSDVEPHREPNKRPTASFPTASSAETKTASPSAKPDRASKPSCGVISPVRAGKTLLAKPEALTRRSLKPKPKPGQQHPPLEHVPPPPPPRELPSSRVAYHVALMEAILRVTADLKRTRSQNGRRIRYSFADWAWFLKLLGEDEAAPHTHKKAEPHVHDRRPLEPRRLMHHVERVKKAAVAGVGATHGSQTGHRGGGGSIKDGDGLRSPHAATENNAGPSPGEAAGLSGTDHGVSESQDGKSDDGVVAPRATDKDTVTVTEPAMRWSWVGHRSPLAMTTEEPEWLLDRLEKRLAEELKIVRAEEIERSRHRQQQENEGPVKQAQNPKKRKSTHGEYKDMAIDGRPDG